MMPPLPYHAYYRLMRLDKPVGIWLLMWPCWWSVALASGQLRPDLLALFFLGAVFMRSAGCIINDITDRKIDAQVERTRHRPIASGEVSVGEGVVLVCFLMILALVVAAMLGGVVVKLALVWTPLVIAYPWMKRIIAWPQLFLGLTFNAGALLGWVAVRGVIEWPAVALYLGGVFWTLGYDTIYALQDKEDDAKIGVRSTALSFGTRAALWVGGFYALQMACLAAAGRGAGLIFPYYLLLIPMAAHLTWQTFALQPDNSVSCRRIFVTNGWAGALVFLAIFLSGAKNH